MQAYKLQKGDIVELYDSQITNPKDIKVNKFTAIDQQTYKVTIQDEKTTDTFGLINQRIIEKYKFKEVINIFINWLFRKNRIAAIHIITINEPWENNKI